MLPAGSAPCDELLDDIEVADDEALSRRSCSNRDWTPILMEEMIMLLPGLEITETELVLEGWGQFRRVIIDIARKFLCSQTQDVLSESTIGYLELIGRYSG